MNIWAFISNSDFEPPNSPPQEVARGGVSQAWHWLRNSVLHRSTGNTSSESTSGDRPADALKSIFSQPDWSAAAESLAIHLRDWFDNTPADRAPVRVIIGPPGCDVAGILQILAQERQLRVLDSPPCHFSEQDGKSEAVGLPRTEGAVNEIVVIPHFERYYLRHEEAIAVMRRLTERLRSRGRVLLGCDSWAWAFLQQAIGVEDILGSPMMMAPFDADRLDAWLRLICGLHKYDFRQLRDDEPVFSPVPDRSGSNGEPPGPEPSVFIKSLAAQARGNPGIALALWNCSLRTHDPQSNTNRASDPTSRSIIRVVFPSDLELPTLPANVNGLHISSFMRSYDITVLSRERSAVAWKNFTSQELRTG